MLSEKVAGLIDTRQFLQRRFSTRRTCTIRKFHHGNYALGRIGAGIACADAEYMFRKTPLKIGGDACVVTAVLALKQI